MDDLLFHRLGHVINIERNFPLAQLWGVEGLQVVVVERGMLLGQTERLMRLAILVNIAEIRFAIEAIVTLRGEDKPTAIAAPGVISVTLCTIDNGESVDGACLQVHHLEISLWVPDGEGAIVGNGVKYILTIWTDTRMTHTPF